MEEIYEVSARLALRVVEFVEHCDMSQLSELGASVFGESDSDVQIINAFIESEE